MPYYFGAGSPGWDEHHTTPELENFDGPLITLFEYIEPEQAKATVVSFPDVPGLEPAIPGEPRYPGAASKVLSKRGFFSRLLGKKPAPATTNPDLTTQDSNTQFQEMENATSKHALWRVSAATANFRALGVKRVIGTYDGGGDESFTYCQFAEMIDGRRVRFHGVQGPGAAFEGLIDDAATAIMGGFDAGEFILRGALTIDFEACTITDEKDRAIVVGLNATKGQQ